MMMEAPTTARKVAKGILLLFAAFLCIVACKSTKSVQRAYEDSTQVHIYFDTNRVQIIDTLHTEIVTHISVVDSLHIIFAGGGGTYDTRSGIATNVASVKAAQSHDEQHTQVIYHHSEINAIQAKYDSLFAEYKKRLIMEDKESAPAERSRWAVFCSYYTIISLLIIAAAAVVYAYTRKNAIFAICRKIFARW